MNDVLQQLLTLGPGIAQGVRGNGQGMQAFMEAYRRTQAELDQRERQQQMDQVSLQDRQRMIERQSTADRLAQEDRAARQVQQGQADALQRLQIPGHLAELGATGETPDDAKHLIETALPQLMQAFGQETMAFGQPAVDMAQRTITARQKRQIGEFVGKAMGTSFIADNPDADPEITHLPEHIQRILGKPVAKLSELQQFAELPVGKPAGKTRVPAAAGSFEDYVEKAYGPSPTPEQILAARKAYMQSDDRPRVTVNTGGAGAYPPNVQRRIDAVIKGFDAQPVVKRTQVMSEGVNFAQSLKDNTTNPADDQALIYAFAKVMDPESVVREGEYATVQKYAQSWAERFGFDVKRIFSNTSFLTPEARRNMKATLMTKFAVERKAYDNIRSEYGKRIDRITMKSGGIEELTDYGAAFPQAPNESAGPKVGERRKVKGVLAEWDGQGWLPVVKP